MRARSFSSLPTSDSPATAISPSVGVSRPATRLRSVDLPQPEGPMTATNSPGSITKSTPRRARTGTPSDSYVLRSPVTSSTRSIATAAPSGTEGSRPLLPFSSGPMADSFWFLVRRHAGAVGGGDAIGGDGCLAALHEGGLEVLG